MHNTQQNKDQSILNIRHLFSFISPSVFMLQFYALYGQREEVLLFVLHIGTGLSDNGFEILWFTIIIIYIKEKERKII